MTTEISDAQNLQIYLEDQNTKGTNPSETIVTNRQQRLKAEKTQEAATHHHRVWPLKVKDIMTGLLLIEFCDQLFE